MSQNKKMEHRKTRPGSQFGSSAATSIDPSDRSHILSLADTIIANADSVLPTRPGPERSTRLKALMQILDPEKNKFRFSEDAYKLVCDAWCVLFDLQRLTDVTYPVQDYEKDNDLEKTEKKKSVEEDSGEKTFWTLCPYCYILFEYEIVYKDCCLRCQNCRRGFHGVAVPEPKGDVLVEGQDAYYCGFGVFPMKFNVGETTKTDDGDNSGGGGDDDDVIVVSDSDADESVGEKKDAKRDENAKEVIREGFSNVMQGSDNVGKKRVYKKSMGRKSKVVRERAVEGRGFQGLDHNVKSSAHGEEIESEDVDSDLEFFEEDGEVFVCVKFDE